MRGFRYVRRYILECKNEEPAAALPVRKTARSAGYDFMSPKKYFIYPHEYAKIPLGVKAYMEPDEYLALYVRSSLGIKKGLVLMNTVGIIDSDYVDNPDNEGEIIACIYNSGDDPVLIQPGERIVQGIFCKYLTEDNDMTTAERVGGIGSTDK